ncbi:ArsR/SmtB family transcription factor [Leifsonia sp. NPDC058292]|uniref:ArsR/SmtB family transcription factor n=1 Tax=Leifsonia sp. NPDC058292 TaxID=3346428 RepID=UPI0036D88D1E
MQADEAHEGNLDKAFQALGDPVRRAIVARLSRGPATVNELAEPFEITTQAVSRHIHVLEEAQLVTRTKDAQRRPVHLNPGRLEELTAWIDRYRLILEQQFRSLDAVLAELDETGTDEERPSAREPSAPQSTHKE